MNDPTVSDQFSRPSAPGHPEWSAPGHSVWVPEDFDAVLVPKEEPLGELDTMDEIAKMLENLTPLARLRVLRWVASYTGVEVCTHQ